MSADEAGSLLAARFAVPGSSGVSDVLQHVASRAAAAAAPPAATTAAAGRAAAQPAGPTAADYEAEELAAALASVPERAAGVQLAPLSAERFVPKVTSSLLQRLAALSATSSPAAQGGSPQPAANSQAAQQGELEHTGASAATAAATAFVADVVGRFCRRGHAVAAAAALLDIQRQSTDGSALASSVLAAVPDAAALDKLVEAVLKQAAAHAAAAAVASNCSSQRPALPLDASPGDDPAAGACAAVLAALLPPAVWHTRADARLLLTEKLLVQQQRRLLPMPALRGLLLFLSRQAGERDGALLADVAANVARLWGDGAAVQRLSTPHQAYLTATLCGCLALLPRRQLDGHPGLLPLLLSGITTRLDSPLLASPGSSGCQPCMPAASTPRRALAGALLRPLCLVTARFSPSLPATFLRTSALAAPLLDRQLLGPSRWQRPQHLQRP